MEEEDEIDDLDSTLPYALPDPKEMQQQQPLVQPDNNFLEVRSIRSKLRFDVIEFNIIGLIKWIIKS